MTVNMARQTRRSFLRSAAAVGAVTHDPQSNMSLYPQYATQLALKDKVAVVHGGITSASARRSGRSSIGSRRSTSTTRSTRGGVRDCNRFALGAAPARTVDKLVPRVMNLRGRRV